MNTKKVSLAVSTFLAIALGLIIGTKTVRASCLPPECGEPGVYICLPTEHCYDKCCVPNTSPCDPVPGGWSAWSICDSNCMQYRHCNNPPPSCNGADCSGLSAQSCTGGDCNIPTPTPTPFSPPTNLTVACGTGGTSATFCWDDENAPKYNLRVNSSYNPDYTGADPYDIWTCNALTPSGGRVCQPQAIEPGMTYSNWDVGSTSNCDTDRVFSSQAPAFACYPSSCTISSINPTSVVGSPDGQTTVTYSGRVDSTASTQDVRLFLERRDSQPVSNGTISPLVGTYGNYYQVAECSATPGGSCSGSVNVTAPPGEYYFHCDVANNPGRCSGNPFCPYEGCTSNCADCSGWQSCSTSDNGTFDVSPPPCTLSLIPKPATVTVGASTTLTASITTGTVERVDFSSSDILVATVTSPDSTTPYQTTATGGRAGSSIITANGITAGSVQCTDQSTLSVTPADPWWQVKDADVVTSGSLSSKIPITCTLPTCNPIFDLIGTGGYPGVPVYAVGSASFGSGIVSTTPPFGWLANTMTSNRKQYNYAWFKKLIPSDVVPYEIPLSSIPGSTFTSGGAFAYGVYWYHYGGDLTITGPAALGTRKVILLVEEGDLTIDGRITLTPGQGFFMVLVGENSSGGKGNINVSSSLGGGVTPHLEGFYEADNDFHTGAGTSQLYIRGSVAAYGGVKLERDLTNNSTTPAEVFEYAPDLIFTYPYKLRERPIFWQEVAP